jgi:hypothetical protein
LVHPSPNSTKGEMALQAEPSGTGNLVTISGWAFDTQDGKPVKQVIAVSDGRVVASLTPSLARADVAAAVNNPLATSSGYQFQFWVAKSAGFRIYAVNVDGTVTPLSTPPGVTSSGTASQVTTSDGHVHPVRISASEGSIDTASEYEATRSFTLTIPPGTDLADYQWMEMRSPSGFGRSRIELTDNLTGGASHVIAFNTLPRVGDSVFNRVGSCLQWHGYATTKLTLLVHGPSKAFTVELLK